MARSKRSYILLCTVPSKAEANRIVQVLIEEKLAACVNLIPNVQSVFRWQGKIENAREHLLVIKTRESHLNKVRDAICRHHSYQVPEIIGWPIQFGHRPYLDWVSSSIS